MLSGVTSKEDAASREVQADLVFPTIAELTDALIQAKSGGR